MMLRAILAALLAHARSIPRDVATVTVAACLALVLAWIAYVRIAHPRHDQWQPEELSYARGRSTQANWLAGGGSAPGRPNLSPPFSPAQGNGVRKIK